MRGLPLHDMKVYFGKLSAQWLDIYYYCHNSSLTGLAQWCFPNGLPLYSQPNYIPEIFRIIEGQIDIATKQAKADPSNQQP